MYYSVAKFLTTAKRAIRIDCRLLQCSAKLFVLMQKTFVSKTVMLKYARFVSYCRKCVKNAFFRAFCTKNTPKEWKSDLDMFTKVVYFGVKNISWKSVLRNSQ